MANPSNFGGVSEAWDFAFGVNPSVSPLTLASSNTGTGSQTYIVNVGEVTTADGVPVFPLVVGGLLTVGTASTSETVTITAVSASNPLAYQQCTFTASFSNAHGAGEQVSSGSIGLQEALTNRKNAGGGQVVLTPKWTANGGTQAMINSAVIAAGCSINDNRTGGGSQIITVTLSATQVNTMYTTPIELLPAPGATQMYLIDRATLINENGGTAWTSGGAITIGYGSSVTTQALSGTVAATFLTSPTVTQVITLAGAQISTSTASTFLNQGVYINNATGVFATGTGTMKVKLQYSVVNT